MKKYIKTLPVNHLGRDFVIGDLHGAFSSLQNLLLNINFDKNKDRLISVGDLVDRGPNSLDCLRLLTQSWFHCVLSNHEQMMLEAFQQKYMGQFWQRNGGDWGIEAKNEYIKNSHRSKNTNEIIDLVSLINNLPYLITVNCANNKKIHVIHAELPPDVKPTDEDLADEDTVNKLATAYTSDGPSFFWGRHIFMNFFGTNLINNQKNLHQKINNKNYAFNDKLSHVISGHTIMSHPITVMGQTNIDTGAYKSYTAKGENTFALTCVELQNWKFYQSTENTFKQIEPIVVGA